MTSTKKVGLIIYQELEQFVNILLENFQQLQLVHSIKLIPIKVEYVVKHMTMIDMY